MSPSIDEYMAAIREQVCTRCAERPHDGSRCLPLGKRCGIELHLQDVVDSVHGVHSSTMDPYEDEFHHHVCEDCAFHGSRQCLCPLNNRLVLAVQAIESVDERHAAD